MEKLRQIREALETNPDITVVKAEMRESLTGAFVGFFGYNADFYVAPRKRCGIYDAGELQQLLLSLVPGLKPDEKKDSFRDARGGLCSGYLQFYEAIGKVKVREEITLDYEELYGAEGFVNGKLSKGHTYLVQSRITVGLYPSIGWAEQFRATNSPIGPA